MFGMSWITAILQLYSQVTDLFGNVIVRRTDKRLFDLFAHFITYSISPVDLFKLLLIESRIDHLYNHRRSTFGPTFY